MTDTTLPTETLNETTAEDATRAATVLGAGDEAVRLELEQPQPGSVIHADETLLGFGWALAATPIAAIRVELDGQHLCDAVTGLARTDVAELYVDHPGSARAGFTFVTRLPPRPSGMAELRLIVRSAAGEQAYPLTLEVIGGVEPAVEALLLPPEPSPPPPDAAVADLEPIRLELEEARIDSAGALHVRGWVLAAREVRSVEVFFGQRTLGFADTGLSRADVAGAFPAYPNPTMAGFALATPLAPEQIGAENVTVVATDGAGETLSATRQATGNVQGATSASAPARLAPMLVTLEETRINEIGVLRVRGWAVSLSAIEQVRVFLGEQQIGVAAQNMPREDVGQAHPAYPNAPIAGFLLQLDVPDEHLVGQTLRVVVAAAGGIRRETTALVAAAPVIRRRERETAEVHFHCDAISLTEDGTLYVKGWAVCPSGTESIELDLDEETLGSADLGEERIDVGNHFPLIQGARNAGFRFVGRAAGRCEGEHIARATVRGRGGESRAILLPVLAERSESAPAPAQAAAAGSDAGIRFYLDNPAVKDGRATEAVRGFLSIQGWAFSGAGITSIEVFVDGRSQGQVHRGIRREDLHKVFGRKEALRSGFAMLVPPQVLKQGHHDMRVVIRDGAGHQEQAAFSVEAEPSLEGPGPWSLRRKITQAEADLHLSLLAAAGFAPAWTLVLPVEGAAAAQVKRLRATLESVRAQAYEGWTAVLPVADAAAREELLAALLDEAADLADRLRVVVADPATPLAEFAAAGAAPRLLALLSPGDLLGEDALLELSIEAAGAERPDLIYSDERRHDPSDGQTRAFFKPDWSPDLLLSTNYIGRLWAATPDLLGRSGLLLGDLARHGEYDATLRLTERARRIAHVAKVLCARGARALDTPAVERRALQRALTRRGIAAEIAAGCLPGIWRVRRGHEDAPLISIIIPTIAARGLIRTAIGSIRERSLYRNFEIVCLDNIREGESADGATWKAWFRENADTVVEIGERFNWSRFNNIGARAARGDVLLFLNDDIEVTDGNWLEGLLEHALRPEVGAVGPQLLYPDGKVQHAGMFLSGSVGRHAFRFSPHDQPGPFGLALTQRNVISVTGACLMVRRDNFEALGGFDEEHSVINNDLDYCLRARASGRVVLYTPHVTLIHHEMVSRGEITDIYNAGRFDTAWKDIFLTGDPYFNPNLSGDYEDYVPDQEPVQALSIGHPVIARERVRHLLAVKVDHIGDFISAFPAFRRLKQRFPNAELTVLAAEASMALVSLEPAIDRAIRFDYFHARSERGKRAVGKKELQRLHEELAPFRFDLAVDLRRQPDTRHILQHTGARWLAGFDTENRTEWLDIAVEWEGDIALTHKRTHISEALVQFIDAVAVACETDRRVIAGGPRAAEARAALAALPEVAALGLAASGRPLVCVHTGAGAENKQWPLASFAGLIDLLVARHDANIVVIGGPDEAANVAHMLRLSREHGRVASLVGTTRLRDLPMVLMACDLYVGNDSGPKHMAASLGVPTVAIHSGTVDTVEWGPLGPASVALRRAMTCSPCYLAKVSDCHRGLGCLTGIRVGDVYRQCRRLLALAGAARAAGAAKLAAPAPAA
jgi:ADP-heptose:LPS heptosyltransferase/GT2 family glycosyltransferase